MTFEDVKRIRKNPTAEDCDNKELSKMIDIAIEKQIPKKPWKPFTTSNNIFACSCNHAVSKGDKYCTVCGQALDWSDTEWLIEIG